jgi:hypothetical protein
MVIAMTRIIIFHDIAHQTSFYLKVTSGQNFRNMSIGEHSETANTKSDRQNDRKKKKKKTDEAK